MEQLIINKPSDPLAFLIEQLKRENDDGNNQFKVSDVQKSIFL